MCATFAEKLELRERESPQNTRMSEKLILHNDLHIDASDSGKAGKADTIYPSLPMSPLGHYAMHKRVGVRDHGAHCIASLLEAHLMRCSALL